MENSQTKTLLTPVKVGAYELKNRIVMASLSRGRTDKATGVPNERMLKYYKARASAGLILTEASPLSMEGHPWPGAGCIYNEEHAAGWKKITDALHEENCRMFVQVWHGGRQSLPTFTKIQSVAPSEVNLHRMNFDNGQMEDNLPRAATLDDIKRIKEDYRNAAKMAKLAGFDGLELHGANGYLIDEFIRSHTNRRTDDYGGSVENRCRLCLEVIDIFIEEYGADKVGIKLSPIGRYGDMYDENPLETYTYLTKELDKRGIAYIQFYESDAAQQKSQFKDGKEQIPDGVAKAFRPYFKGAIMSNGGFTPETGAKIIEDKIADCVSFGKLFINNPDLVDRVKNDWALNTNYNWNTFWFGGDEGYIDFLTYPEELEKKKKEAEKEGKTEQPETKSE